MSCLPAIQAFPWNSISLPVGEEGGEPDHRSQDAVKSAGKESWRGQLLLIKIVSASGASGFRGVSKLKMHIFRVRSQGTGRSSPSAWILVYVCSGNHWPVMTGCLQGVLRNASKTLKLTTQENEITPRTQEKEPKFPTFPSWPRSEWMPVHQREG